MKDILFKLSVISFVLFIALGELGVFIKKPQVRLRATPTIRADDSNLTSILKQEALDSEYSRLWKTDI